jgi:rhodanese-related sulfurtransferase
MRCRCRHKEARMKTLIEEPTLKRLAVASALLLAVGCATATPGEQIRRIPPRDAHERVEKGEALLVCAYREKDCRGTHLIGEISLENLEARLPSVAHDQEILFVCGCPKEASAAHRAAEFRARGFTNVGVVAGGFLAWILEGYDVTPSRKGALTWAR